MDLNRLYSGARLMQLGALSLSLGAGIVKISAQEASEPEPENSVTNKVSLKVDVRRNVEGTYMPYRFAFITSGFERFTFLIPEDYRVDTSDLTKVKLSSPDYTSLIVVGVEADGYAPGAKMDAEALRARALSLYPEAVIKDENTAAANGLSAPAIDFCWKTPSGITRMTRTTFIPTSVGLMEFTLTASPEKFEAGLREFNLVMLTFRSGINGKFDYVVGAKLP